MKTNLLQLGTQGVDMKSNPLLLGNKKLHAATNIAFDEGVIRTRPGFRYVSLGAEGQFQGACEYRPKEGLSSSILTDVDSGIAVVADGVLWFECNPISESLFECAGSVNLFQAENYLVLQNTTTDTFWWDGSGDLVRSPGMVEQDWTEPEVPMQELNTAAPEANIPECGSDGLESGIEVRFLVIDHLTEAPIPNVVWTVNRHGHRAYWGTSGTDGRFQFNPRPRVYAYDLRKDGYTAIEDVNLEVNGSPVERVWDDCFPPNIEIVGEYDYIVRMVPVSVPGPCFEVATEYVRDGLGNPIVTEGTITLTNISDEPRNVYGLILEDGYTHDSVFPLTLTPNEQLLVRIMGMADLLNMLFSFSTQCGDNLTNLVFIDGGSSDCLLPDGIDFEVPQLVNTPWSETPEAPILITTGDPELASSNELWRSEAFLELSAASPGPSGSDSWELCGGSLGTSGRVTFAVCCFTSIRIRFTFGASDDVKEIRTYRNGVIYDTQSVSSTLGEIYELVVPFPDGIPGTPPCGTLITVEGENMYPDPEMPDGEISFEVVEITYPA